MLIIPGLSKSWLTLCFAAVSSRYPSLYRFRFFITCVPYFPLAERSAFLQKLTHSLLRHLESLPLQAPNFSVYIYLFIFNYLYLFILYLCFFIFITCPVPSCFASSTRPSCKSSTLCFAPSRVATTLCTGPEFYIYLFFMFYLFFIYNMLSSRICWSLRALGLLAKADPLSASRRLESLPLFVQAPNFSVYIYLFTFIYLYLCFCFFYNMPSSLLLVASSARPSCKSWPTLCFAPSRVASPLCTGATLFEDLNFSVYIYIYFILFTVPYFPLAGRFERSAFLQMLTHSLLRTVSSRSPYLYRPWILAFIQSCIYLFIYNIPSSLLLVASSARSSCKSWHTLCFAPSRVASPLCTVRILAFICVFIVFIYLIYIIYLFVYLCVYVFIAREAGYCAGGL